MKKSIMIKAASAILGLALAAVIAIPAMGAEASVPENPIPESGKTVLEPEIMYSDSSETVIEESDGTDDENTETLEYELPPQDEKQEESSETNENDEPLPDGNGDVSDEAVSGENGEPSEEGDAAGQEEDLHVETDLDTMTVYRNDLDGDTFFFYAYPEGKGADECEVRVSFRSKDSPTSYLDGTSGDFGTVLSIGDNYFSVYLMKGGKTLSSDSYVITYEASMASEKGESIGGVTLETNFGDIPDEVETKNFVLKIAARDSKGKYLPSDHVEVLVDGEEVRNHTGSGKLEYNIFLGTDPSEYSDHTIEVTCWDDDGGSAYDSCDVVYHNIAEGAGMGQVTVVVDGTSAGFGVIGDCEVEVKKGDNAATVLERAFAELGLKAISSGSAKAGYYLAGVSGIGSSSGVPDDLKYMIEQDGLSITNTGPVSGSLTDGYGTTLSGWMYCINGNDYAGRGLSEYELSPGDTLYLRFSLAMGKDVGGSSGYGALDYYCGEWTDGNETADHDLEPDGEGHLVCSNCGYTEDE